MGISMRAAEVQFQALRDTEVLMKSKAGEP